MAKAINCNESCSNYEACKAEDMITMFMPNATCSDYNEKEESQDGQA